MYSKEKATVIIVLLLFIGFTQFCKFDGLAYRIWDEARLATNAYEMSKTGNWVVTTINYAPDMWNTKPPLMIWLQAGCIRLFGLSEFATRLPAVLAAAFTVLLIFAVVLQATQSHGAALLAGMVLCTSQGYITFHGSRFGEYDSLLTLLTTAYLACFFLYTETQGRQANFYLLLFFAGLTLAVLTKGIAGFLFCPFLFIYLCARFKLLSALKNKYLYLGLATFLLVTLGYYLLREYHNPGYLQAVAENELGGRFSKPLEGHRGGADFYLHNLRWERFSNWHWALVLSFIAGLFSGKSMGRRLLLFSFFAAAFFLAVISNAQTKLNWYDLPVYPLFAITVGVGMLSIAKALHGRFTFLQQKIVLYALIILFSIQPVYQAYGTIKYADYEAASDFYGISYYLRNALMNNHSLDGYTYFYTGYSLQWKLYVNALRERGDRIALDSLTGFNRFGSGSKLITHQTETQTYVESSYHYKLIDQKDNIKLYEIISPLK